MWIHSRTPSPSRCADTASSKSRALAGSTVNVARSRRSRRVGSTFSARSGAPPASASRRAVNPRRSNPSQRIASTTSRARFGDPSKRTALAPRAVGAARIIFPGWASSLPRSSATWPPRSNSGSTTRKRPRRATTPTNALARSPRLNVGPRPRRAGAGPSPGLRRESVSDCLPLGRRASGPHRPARLRPPSGTRQPSDPRRRQREAR